VVHSLDSRTRTMGVEVDIPNPDQKLKPGMFARVEVLVDTRKDVLTLPLEALRVGEARPSVMVVRNGLVEPVFVELGLSDSRFIEVRQGLGEQDQVIVQGKDLVKAKQKVRTVPATGQ
jgi:multidrug efflux pump subunit AcrA (membrane-fusion protein)